MGYEPTEIFDFVNNVTNQTKVKTMSSREIAKLTDKQHKHVIRDIEEMFKSLETNEPRFGPVDFQGSYKDKKGEVRKCYHLPKRECLILVSGYDVNLRARIIDRWAELEVEKRTKAPKPPKAVSPNTIMKFHKHLESLAMQAGLKENQLLLKVNRGVASITGVNQLEAMDIKHLPAPNNDEYITPTQIGERLNPPMSAREVNIRFLNLGLQINKSSGGYMPTAKGEEYGGRVLDISKLHTDGSTQQLKWNAKIIVPYFQSLLNINYIGNNNDQHNTI